MSRCYIYTGIQRGTSCTQAHLRVQTHKDSAVTIANNWWTSKKRENTVTQTNFIHNSHTQPSLFDRLIKSFSWSLKPLNISDNVLSRHCVNLTLLFVCMVETTVLTTTYKHCETWRSESAHGHRCACKQTVYTHTHTLTRVPSHCSKHKAYQCSSLTEESFEDIGNYTVYNRLP